MFYVFRVRSAIAQLGVSPRLFGGKFGEGAKYFGKRLGLRPKEVALFMVAQLPRHHHLNLNHDVIILWAAKEEINLHNEGVQTALNSLGLQDSAGTGPWPQDPLETPNNAESSAQMDRERRAQEYLASYPNDAPAAQVILICTETFGARSAREAAEQLGGRELTDAEWEEFGPKWERAWNFIIRRAN